MTLIEKKGDVFSLQDTHYIAHCISSDCVMGAGIAVEIDKKFNMQKILLKDYNKEERQHPTCILEDSVFNLITKDRYYDLPKYDDLGTTLEMMRNICIRFNIKKLVIPKIGCGLDRLRWSQVKKMILSIFNDVDIQIVVMSKE